MITHVINFNRVLPRDEDPDPLLFSRDPDPDPTYNNGYIKLFSSNQNQQIHSN